MRKRVKSGNKAGKEQAIWTKNVTSKRNQEKTKKKDTSINEENVYIVVDN